MDNKSLTTNDLIRNIIELFSPFIGKRISTMPYSKGKFCLNGIQFITCIPRKPSDDRFFNSSLYPYVNYSNSIDSNELFNRYSYDIEDFVNILDVDTPRIWRDMCPYQYINFVYYKIAICFQHHYSMFYNNFDDYKSEN